MRTQRTVKITDLVNASDVARRLGVSRAAVSNWHVRHKDFPKPILGTAVYRWPEVERWAKGRPTRHLRIAAALQAADDLALVADEVISMGGEVNTDELNAKLEQYRRLRG